MQQKESRRGILEFITESVHFINKADRYAGFYVLFILWMNVFCVTKSLLWYFNYKLLTLKLVIGRISPVSTSHWMRRKCTCRIGGFLKVFQSHRWREFLGIKSPLLGLWRSLLKGFIEFQIAKTTFNMIFSNKKQQKIQRTTSAQHVLGSIPASSDTVESEGRQMKQCWIQYIKNQKIPL